MEAGTVPEKVTISHRGARYEIGRGKRFFGIWAIGAPESDPIDRWPENHDGWEQAWTRFVALETPDTITPVEPTRGRLALPRPRLKLPRPKRMTVRPGMSGSAIALAGSGLLGLGVLLGLIGLFPGYIGPQSLASQPEQLVPHVLYLAAWAASAVLIASGGARARAGALFATGVSAVTFGLFFADLGQVISGGAGLLGAGLVLSLLGWLACASGSALGLVGLGQGAGQGAGPDRLGRPGRPRGADAGPLALLGLAAVGTAIAFVPSWDSFTLTQTATGATQTITAGYAFANPWPVIFGDVAVMVAVVAVAVLAALWRPPRLGAILLAGAIVPLAAQAISAIVQVSQPATPAMFGISAAGVTITSGLTPTFWVYCVFVISLLISSAWLLTAPKNPAMAAAARPPQPGADHASQSSMGETGDSGDDTQDDEQSSIRL